MRVKKSAFIDIKAQKKIHLMGIGGAGMSGLALLLDSMGHVVSGCDMENSFYLHRLRQNGIQIVMGHHREHLDLFTPDLIVHTSAIAQDHPELIEARRKGIIVARRAEILSLIFNDLRGVGVAGTHGKTTTSSMISLVAEKSGYKPTVAIGGEISDIGCNAKLGDGDYMVAELDESDGSFKLFSPEVAVITNVDWDHIDHYPTFDSVVEAFNDFVAGCKIGAPVIVCGEDPGVQRLVGSKRGNVVTYGWGLGWNWGATDVHHLDGGGLRFTVNRDGRALGEMKLKISGEHNALNSLAAVAAANVMGIPFELAREYLSVFKGAKRRLQLVGDADDIIIYDDYGHHPREIAATLSALEKAFSRRPVHVVFQPHRYTRTQALYRDFARVLGKSAVSVYLLPIFSADEPTIAGVSSFMIADELNAMGMQNSIVCGDFQEACNLVCGRVKPGDLVLTIGAGSVDSLSKQILGTLKKKAALNDVTALGA